MARPLRQIAGVLLGAGWYLVFFLVLAWMGLVGAWHTWRAGD